MNAPTTPAAAPAADETEFQIHALSGAAPARPRALSAPLAAELTATLEAAPDGAAAVRAVDVRVPLLEKNDILAERNRGYFLGRGLAALNLVSSPGAGKTTLLERTLDEFGREVKCGVLVGDLETEIGRAHV